MPQQVKPRPSAGTHNEAGEKTADSLVGFESSADRLSPRSRTVLAGNCSIVERRHERGCNPRHLPSMEIAPRNTTAGDACRHSDDLWRPTNNHAGSGTAGPVIGRIHTARQLLLRERQFVHCCDRWRIRLAFLGFSSPKNGPWSGVSHLTVSSSNISKHALWRVSRI